MISSRPSSHLKNGVHMKSEIAANWNSTGNAPFGLARTRYHRRWERLLPVHFDEGLRMRQISWLAFICLALATGCDAPPAGSEGGPCYGNQTCNEELTCASDLCVRFGGRDGEGEG